MIETIQTRTTYTHPAPPPVVLCAWVRNPFKLFDHDPNYLRAEIVSVNGQEITVKEYNSANIFKATRADVHKVHTVNTLTGETWQVLGEPKPC